MNELCKICERVQFGDIVRLGHGVWRHETCCIGSEEWALYFERLPREEKAKLADLYRCFIGVSAEGSNNSTEGE
jgi:hypothetical protein